MRRSDPRRGVAVASLLAVLLAGALAACSDDDAAKPTSSTARTAPPTSTPSSDALEVGDVITGKGTVLRAPPEPETRQIDAEAGCRTFLPASGEGECALVGTAGGPAIWTLVPVRAVGPDEKVWRLRIWTQSETLPDGGWRVALELPRRAGGFRPLFGNVAVRAADLTGDGQPELLVGYRSGGTGQFESYDVVAFALGAQPKVTAHRGQLHKGSVVVAGTDVVDYSADESSPECCPRSSTRTTIAWRDGAFRITDITVVPIDEQPPDLFA